MTFEMPPSSHAAVRHSMLTPSLLGHHLVMVGSGVEKEFREENKSCDVSSITLAKCQMES